jgi:hypothetical protein
VIFYAVEMCGVVVEHYLSMNFEVLYRAVIYGLAIVYWLSYE